MIQFPFLSDKKDATNPATTSMAYDTMLPYWNLVNTLLDGTAAMRAAGEAYLPKHEYESAHNYVERLNCTTLYNAFELTLDRIIGRPFSDPVQFTQDVPQQILDLMQDVDQVGTPITTFCRHWFREGVAKGFSHILIDMPALPENERQGRTKADDLADARRPFWNLVRPENILFASSSDGVELDHVRIAECVITRNGFAEEVTYRIRVLEPGTYAVYEYRRVGKSNKWKWVQVDAGTTSLPYIPLITYYASAPEGLMMAKPPLQDLAHLNVTHWQSSSDQRNILTVSRFPILASSGVKELEENPDVPLGPRNILATGAPDGKFYFVTHDGKAVEVGTQDLKDLEDRMTSYGSMLITRKTGNASATAHALDSAESASPLEDMSLRFCGAINAALQVTADWLGVEMQGKASITVDFGPEELANIDLQTLNFMRAGGPGRVDLSQETMWEELKRRGLFSDEFTAERERQRLKAEFASGATPDPMKLLTMAAPQHGGSPNRGVPQSDTSKDDAASGSTNSQRGAMKAQGDAKNKGAV